MAERRGRASAVGSDTGGTFTDFVARVNGRLVAFKLPSTPAMPEQAVLAGLARLGSGAGTRVRLGSTLATNALLERKGARVAFVTTAGFEDVLEIGRQDRPDLYALRTRRVAPLVPADRRVGVRERLGPGGVVWAALGGAEVRRTVARVRRLAPEAIAVGFLHAWASPRHERRIARALAALGVPLTTSSALAPEVREVERFATTVANAFLLPRVSAWLDALRRSRRGRFEIVLSHGGTAPPARAAREPVRQLLSGPAAGLRAAWDAASACGFRTAVTLDVGGTSTDCAWLGGDGPGADPLPRRRAREVAGIPVLLPALDVHTVGAGGGSIASVDAGGVLQVGPASAGADPGPACYGRGGPATVTDALVVLGLLPFTSLAGGSLPLDRAAAQRALGALARSLGSRDAVRAAEGVLTIANARMEEALRRVSVEAGADPRGAALVAFGGAGGLHACALAASLGAAAVLWPRHAGVLCAYGALTSGARRERSRSVLLDARDRRALARAFRALERDVLAEFAPRERRGVRLERWAELRTRGQAHELTVPAGGDLAARFLAAHRRRFGFAEATRAIDVVTVEVRGTRPDPLAREPRATSARLTAKPAKTPARHAGREIEAAVYARESLGRGARIRGPALVLDAGATFWLPPAWAARVEASGAIVARAERRAR